MSDSNSRYLGAAVGLIAVVGVLGVVGLAYLWVSDASTSSKVLGSFIVGLLIAGASVRMWMASQPYGAARPPRRRSRPG